MLSYRVLIFGNGCFRSWVTFLFLLPAAIDSPTYLLAAFFIFLPLYLPIYVVAALEEWIFRLVVEHDNRHGVPYENTLHRIVVASLLAPAVLTGVVLLPIATVLFAPMEGFRQVFIAVAVVAAALTVASFLVTLVRRRAIVDDLLGR